MLLCVGAIFALTSAYAAAAPTWLAPTTFQAADERPSDVSVASDPAGDTVVVLGKLPRRSQPVRDAGRHASGRRVLGSTCDPGGISRRGRDRCGDGSPGGCHCRPQPVRGQRRKLRRGDPAAQGRIVADADHAQRPRRSRRSPPARGRRPWRHRRGLGHLRRERGRRGPGQRAGSRPRMGSPRDHVAGRPGRPQPGSHCRRSPGTGLLGSGSGQWP